MEENYKSLVYKNLKNLYWNQLGLKDYEKRIQQRMDRIRGRKVAQLMGELGLLRGKILDVGSGWGEMICEISKNAKENIDLYGIEPDQEELLISKMLIQQEKITANLSQGFAEDLKFPENYFDLVICFNVIEHVRDYKKSLKEMIRVLRPGGVLYLNAPNYLYPYEGHYKIFYPSLIPKWLGRIYLSALGRDSGFLKDINYITSYKIFHEIKKYDAKVIDRSVVMFKKKSKNFIKNIFNYLILKFKLYPVIDIVVYKK